MKYDEFMTTLEKFTYKVNGNIDEYEIKIDLDHSQAPDRFIWVVNEKEKTITIIKGNRGF
jgi:hypothetical protein